jgi:hypothetical protein
MQPDNASIIAAGIGQLNPKQRPGAERTAASLAPKSVMMDHP